MEKRRQLYNEAKALPELAGVYVFREGAGKVIYVGKAKNLRNRVTSYFTGTQTGKTRVLVSKIRSISHIVVDNESEALLLENNLIKKHQPRYNVLLKDDKTFPWICIRKEPFPRLILTRKIIRDGSEYFGPYTSVVTVRTLLDLIRKLFPLRTCNLNLSPDNIAKKKYKVCLEYHIGNCRAPCIGKQEEEKYDNSIRQIREILRGNIYTVTVYLRKMMKKLSGELRFEEAQLVKNKIEALEKYKTKSTVVNPRIRDVDVFGISGKHSNFYVSYLRVIRGAVVQAHTYIVKRQLEESEAEMLSYAIRRLREDNFDMATEIIVPVVPEIKEEGVKYLLPVRGDKKKLVELAQRNALIYRLNQQKRIEESKPLDRSRIILEMLKKDLHLPDIPVHIECFDNSNIQGTSPVAACVVFRNGKPAKKEYRHFHIKTVKGADDFASMEEVVFRRYRRMMDEDEDLPNLVVIDGGKGQLNSAVKSLDQLGIKDKVPIIGIAKKLEEIYFPGDSVPVYLNKKSESLKLIQNLRNEAHRFGIGFHRNSRSKKMTSSTLDNIPGIGKATKEKLLNELGSLNKIAQASDDMLEKLIGKSKAVLIADFFRKKGRIH